MPTEQEFPAETKLARIAWLSGRDPQKKFGCLLHHFNRDSLKAAFHKLDGKKAVGADKVAKEAYAKNLEGQRRFR